MRVEIHNWYLLWISNSVICRLQIKYEMRGNYMGYEWI